ncbi:MAG: hypothetical protein JSU85_05205 [Candidatus Zixiibacteriota bacterium]|nr:MAG: hypothetical protein JSU85_05205 [candidate division Zixibacteria bacterium]
MIEIIDIPVGKVVPPLEDVLSEQGIHDLSLVSERTRLLAEKSIADYSESADPKGIIGGISNSDFSHVYGGEGGNQIDTPLDLVYPKASALALFAVTLGNDISKRVNAYFDEEEFAAGSMLDSAASAGAELSADYAECYFRKKLLEKGNYAKQTGVMRFSPGYCGWHVSGQKKLFEYLHSDKIGIELNDSYLMKPLKSISGVIVMGSKHIFEFEDNFTFCAECSDHSCLERIKSLKENN